MFKLKDLIDENKHPIITFIIVMASIYIVCTVLPAIFFIVFGFNISLKYILIVGILNYSVFFLCWFCQMGDLMVGR